MSVSTDPWVWCDVQRRYIWWDGPGNSYGIEESWEESGTDSDASAPYESK